MCISLQAALGSATHFPNFQAVAIFCIPVLDFLQHADLRGRELMGVAGVQTCVITEKNEQNVLQGVPTIPDHTSSVISNGADLGTLPAFASLSLTRVCG